MIERALQVEELVVAGTLGRCGGVRMAIKEAEQILQAVNDQCIPDLRPQVLSNHALVHNDPEVERLQAMGLSVFENNWDLVPPRSIVILSAHGSPANFPALAEEKDCLVADLTCPLVIGNQQKVKGATRRGYHLVVFGKPKHPEAESYMDHGEKGGRSLVYTPEDIEKIVVPDGKKIKVVTQTTLAVRKMGPMFTDLSERFPGRVELPFHRNGVIGGDTCRATDDRQQAVFGLLEENIDGAVVIGSWGSHNSHELALIAEEAQVPVILVDRTATLNDAWFDGMRRVGLTAGASAADEDVPAFIKYFEERRKEHGLRVRYTEKVNPNERDYFPWTGREEFYAGLNQFLARHYLAS